MRVGQAKNKPACCIDMHCGYIFVYSNPDEGHVAATLGKLEYKATGLSFTFLV